jgi:hypothetical protein
LWSEDIHMEKATNEIKEYISEFVSNSISFSLYRGF